MAIPDISGLTLEELTDLVGQANASITAKQVTADQNADVVRSAAQADVGALIALIGPPATTAQPGLETINELLATPSATIATTPTPYIKATLRILRKVVKAQVNAHRLASGALESTSTGAE